MSARSSIFPDESRTIHFLGDIHCRPAPEIQTRLDKVTFDLNSRQVPTPAAHIQVGDTVDNGGDATQDPIAQTFFASVTDATWRALPGNHDVYQNSRTIAQWAASIGSPAMETPWTWDFSWVRVIGVGSFDGANGDQPYLPQTQLDYLDSALSGTTKDCWVVSHAPLKDTVLGPTSGDGQQWSSAESFFWTHGPLSNSADDSAIRTILGNHSNAKAWICGHTHSAIDAPGFFTTLSLGGHNVAHINTSAIYYIGRTVEIYDPIRSLYVTKTSTGLDIRIRNHGARSWDSLNGSRVTSISL